MIDPGKDALEAATRELLEEAGFEADRWDALGRLAVEPGRHTNYGHVLVARGCRRVSLPDLDATEDLSVRLVDAATLVDRIEAEAQTNGIDPFVAAALIRQESQSSTRATSGVGARGLMQLMPSTGRTLALEDSKGDSSVRTVLEATLAP